MAHKFKHADHDRHMRIAEQIREANWPYVSNVIDGVPTNEATKINIARAIAVGIAYGKANPDRSEP